MLLTFLSMGVPSWAGHFGTETHTCLKHRQFRVVPCLHIWWLLKIEVMLGLHDEKSAAVEDLSVICCIWAVLLGELDDRRTQLWNLLASLGLFFF